MTQIVRTHPQPLRMKIVWHVLEAAKDPGVGCAIHVNACRRLIQADHIGWNKHHDPEDWALVKEAYALLRS